MFSPGAYENSAPDGIGVLEVRGEGDAPEGEPRRFVPLKRAELRGEVVGPLASLRLVQVYGYSREQCGQVLEATAVAAGSGDGHRQLGVAGGQAGGGLDQGVHPLARHQPADAEHQRSGATQAQPGCGLPCGSSSLP